MACRYSSDKLSYFYSFYLMLLCVTKVVFNIVEHSISEDVFIAAKEGNRNDKGK